MLDIHKTLADGKYKQAIGILYGIAFTIKMSRKGDHQIDGYFDYVVPLLETEVQRLCKAFSHRRKRLCAVLHQSVPFQCKICSGFGAYR